MEVSLTETGFSGFDAAGFISGGSVGGLGVVDFDFYVGSSNGEFELSQLIASGSASGGAYSFDAGVLDIAPYISGDFSLTLVSTFTASKEGEFFSTDTKAVPEPSIIALFGLGLLGLGFARRRKA